MIIHLEITYDTVNNLYLGSLTDGITNNKFNLDRPIPKTEANKLNKGMGLSGTQGVNRKYQEGDISREFLSDFDVISQATKIWWQCFPEYEFLVLGSESLGEPHLLIDSIYPKIKELKQACAELYEENKNTNDSKTELRLFNTYYHLLNKSQFRAKYLRLMVANAFIRVIGNCGRGFLCYPKQYGHSKLELTPPGRVWYRSGYSNKRYYLHRANWEKHFPEGGTLTQLVAYLKDFILANKKLPHDLFGPYPEWVDEDIWGYGEDMAQVIKFAKSNNLLGEKNNGARY